LFVLLKPYIKDYHSKLAASKSGAKGGQAGEFGKEKSNRRHGEEVC